ncbi:hypothetical protein [Sporosarcina sp. FSL K6-1508]|uniref:hypothetical protein n=1 Tax=Sporosarcina sp. FSL K6-1508 TaxID=2921553 RepID=UPI0030F78BD0
MTVKAGASITIVSSGDPTNNVWIAPAGQMTVPAANGTTITTANGTATSITTPSVSGTYHVYVSDDAGNISAASTESISVDDAAPTVNIISALSATGVISGTSDDNVVTVKVFTDSAHIDEILGSGSVVSNALTWTATSNALDAGIYYVVVTDAVGNESEIQIMAS